MLSHPPAWPTREIALLDTQQRSRTDREPIEVEGAAAIVVTAIVGESGIVVHVTTPPEGTLLDEKGADDLVHAVLEALSE